MKRKARLRKTDDPTVRCCYCEKPGPRAGYLILTDAAGRPWRTPDLCYRCMDGILKKRRAITARDPGKETLIMEEP